MICIQIRTVCQKALPKNLIVHLIVIIQKFPVQILVVTARYSIPTSTSSFCGYTNQNDPISTVGGVAIQKQI